MALQKKNNPASQNVCLRGKNIKNKELMNVNIILVITFVGQERTLVGKE